MTVERDRARELAALEAHLERHGADRTRWPQSAAARFAPFIEADHAAARLYNEARALDSLLDAAPRVSDVRRDALAERILAAARAGDGVSARRKDDSEDRIVAFPTRSRQPYRRPSLARSDWQAAALLAASLLLGVFTGVNGTFDNAISGLASLAGLAADRDGIELALDQTAVPIFDEDAL
jgi:hypothetical protein